MPTPDQIAVHTDLLSQLFPTGIAWPREAGSNLMRLIEGLAEEFAETEIRALRLIEEADPRTTLEMLTDWEHALGLPEECEEPAGTLQERRAAVLEKLFRRGGQSIPYFKDVARQLGYEITLEEFRPFKCGIGKCGHRLGGPATNRFYWKVAVPGPRVVRFKCGASRCGDPLAKISRAFDLECLFQKLKPGHTTLIFSYEGI